ncbi:hypothetical protein Pst134EA_026764 [Puccinia striiformis f. sp. tritici]|uniref:hypothetical protein n=1 Tax=Puccinia striiformis f. sp. tritici TaxID=168172 RepID=UPI002007EDB5|nr:hypothetical protein Pst134EA_026764 [Puccinia striiformis f. sp. tritici]KAH9442972.1 hypothetical protein Pst134EB_027323 [Puccinia striiformis f. sp. tritici]KAH9450052.1 hypothetical protein Pst134EA_026764 [Puccinia striiformis f. sp. tritici]
MSQHDIINCGRLDHVSCSPGQTNVAQKYNGLLKQLANLQINFVNLSPIDFKCQLAKTANIHHHDFIRTPEPCHRLAAQHLWSTLSENSHIHKGKYLDPTTGIATMISIETNKTKQTQQRLYHPKDLT